MTSYLVDGTDLTSVADSIRTKAGSSSSLAFPDGFVEAVESIPTSSSSDEGEVIFIDYTGDIIDKWAVSAAASKTALPTVPTHDRLTGTGWNWTLESIKSYANKYPQANIIVGATYVTTSGNTEILVTINKSTGKTITIKGGTKDWGDGTTDSSDTHTYNDYGDYVVTYNNTTFPSGSSSGAGLTGATQISNPCTYITEVLLGQNFSQLNSYALAYCFSLKGIVLCENIFSIFASNVWNCFYQATSLSAIIFPKNVTMSTSTMFISAAFKLKYISLSYKQTSDIYKFNPDENLTSLEYITIPDGVTSIGLLSSQYANIDKFVMSDTVTTLCNYCYQYSTMQTIDLSHCTLITSISMGCFQRVQATDIYLPPNLTTLNSSAFVYATKLKEIVIPDTVTSIGSNCFDYCHNLTNIEIPNKITQIPDYCFRRCYSLESVIVLGNITRIGNGAFINCYSCQIYDFTNCTSVPTLSNVSAFNEGNTAKKIIVPDSLYENWIVATNWATLANNIYKESEVD